MLPFEAVVTLPASIFKYLFLAAVRLFLLKHHSFQRINCFSKIFQWFLGDCILTSKLLKLFKVHHTGVLKLSQGHLLLPDKASVDPQCSLFSNIVCPTWILHFITLFTSFFIQKTLAHAIFLLSSFAS